MDGEMALQAKQVIDGKFWIVIESGTQIGTIQTITDGKDNGEVVFVKKDMSRERFNSIKILSDKYKVVFEEDTKTTDKSAIDETFNVHGYPCDTLPYNSVYDINKKLPIYTKREKSTSFHCAGYYIVKFPYGWARCYCPKLITVQRYEYRGPFKTKIEMNEELKRANNE